VTVLAELAPVPVSGCTTHPEVELRPLSIYNAFCEEVPMSLQSERLLNHMLRLRLSHLPTAMSHRGRGFREELRISTSSNSLLKPRVRPSTPERPVEDAVGALPLQQGPGPVRLRLPASVDERKLRELASLAFLERKENVLLLGPPGVGKTHLAIALGTEAIVTGSSVYFVTIQDLVSQFQRARDENKLKERMSLLVSPSCSSSTRWLSVAGLLRRTCLFQLVSERYEKARSS